MKKYLKIFLLIILIMPFKSFALEVNDKGYINDNGVRFFDNPNFEGNQVLDSLDTGDQVTLLDKNLVPSKNITDCKDGFYKISFYWESYNKKTYEGYVCASNINFSIDTSKYAEEFAQNNIPEIYWEKLSLIKDTHPNWKFTGYKTNLKWDDVLNVESQVGMSYIQSNNPIYLSLDKGSYDSNNDTYNQMEAGGWYAANKKTVAYYMDPRNFLNEINIFMFENLGYNESYQTKDVLEKLLDGTDLKQYADYFMQAATYNGNKVSPIFLASRSRQEVVKGDGKLSDSANGAIFNDKTIYNFFNIGAFTSCTIDGNKVNNPVMCGLFYASGFNGTNNSYGRPWDTAEKAILNGSVFISEDYINIGQNTLYFQKYNVTNNNTYSHQYMTNISAPYSESVSSYNAYKNINKLDSTIEFLIPVYNEMSTEISALPLTIDTVEKDKIQVTTDIAEVISKSGYKDNGQYINNIKLGTTATHMITAIKTAGGQATITSDGNEISGDQKLGTGDIVNVTVNNETKSYRIVINGDTNGDGEVNAIDYVKVFKFVMGEGTLTGSYNIAADIDGNGEVNAVDYVKVYKYVMDGGNL